MNLLTSLRRETITLLRNLLCGAQLLLLRRRAFERLSVGHDQIFALLLFYAATQIVASYFTTDTPRFDLWGFGVFSAELALTLLLGHVIAKGTGDNFRLPLFVTASYAIAPFVYLIVEIALPRLTPSYSLLIQASTTTWLIAVTFTLSCLMLDGKRLKAIGLTLLWITLTLPLAAEMQSGFWYSESDYELKADSHDTIDAEQLFYDQPALLGQNIATIQPGIDGTTDLFFVGFGAYGGQDVFMKEVNHIQQFSDSHLGTQQRSLLLVNNETTLDTLPLASATNLAITLEQLGERMNRDEDVLLLYLTSHGDKDHTLSVEMWPLPLNDITPETLKQQLDAAGIRWRIILVSACYSGGFVEPLKDERTLVMTAAAPDKTSFGCASENEYTYFGEALFKDQPEEPLHFIPHFEAAIKAIEEREKSEGLEPSEPQLFVGEMMRGKLAQLENEIGNYGAERFKLSTDHLQAANN